jgi:hypothetical protein
MLSVNVSSIRDASASDSWSVVWIELEIDFQRVIVFTRKPQSGVMACK